MNIREALKWSFLSELAAKGVQPLVFILLARLLTPEDFGVVAAATIVISFSQVFWEAGLGRAIVQYQGDRIAAANAAFWINLVLGIAVAAVLVGLSGPVAAMVFHDPRIGPVLRILALQVVLSAAVSVHVALLQKDMRFNYLFWVRLVTVAIPGLVSVPLAWRGMGYWALVAGTLAGQALQVVILWKTSSWSPTFSFDPAAATRLARFGAWVAATGLLTWFYLWADSLVVGMYLGSEELGLYRTGNAFVMMIYGFLFGPLMPVLYSHFSGIQQDRERVRSVLARVIKIITFVAVPMALLVFSNASFVADVVFGPKWEGVELVIAAMALMHGYSWIVGANGEAYRAVGAPAYETKILGVSLILYLVGYGLSIRHGFETFIWTRLGLALAASSIHFWVARKAIDLDVGASIAYLLKITFLCLPAVLITLYIQVASDPASRALGFVLSALLMTGLLWLGERNGLIPGFYALAAKRNSG